MTVVIMSLDKFFGIIMPLIIIPGDRSGPFITIIIGFISRRTITGRFLKMPLSVPTRIIIIRSQRPVLGERNTGAEKYQSGSDQKNFLDIRLHKYSPFSVRF